MLKCNDNMTNPLVSICCITYNHAPFIRKALDGFLMQEPPTGVSADEPWYEILIHDDASTDGTTEIIKEYAAKYPDLIFPLYETENQYSKGHAADIDMYNYKRARGKYIAYCEGDDYWTDPKKLQKQIDWMDMHPDYSVCFHRVKSHDVYKDEYWSDRGGLILGDKEGMDITPDIFFNAWYMQPLSMLFRTSMYDFSLPYKYRYYRDSHEIYHLLKNGKGYLFAFLGGVYNRHQGGIASMIGREREFKDSYVVAEELYRVNKDCYTRDYFIKTLQWLVNSDSYISNSERLCYIHRIFWLNGDILRYIKNIRNLFRSNKNAKNVKKNS